MSRPPQRNTETRVVSAADRSPAVRAIEPAVRSAPVRAVRCDRIVRTRAVSAEPDLSELKQYQAVGVITLRKHKHFLLADEPAVGKTVQALRALEQRPRALVVAPASAAITWRDEVKRWRSDLHLTIGEELRRPDENEVLFISRDSLPEPPRGSTKLVQEPMRDVTLILDECHGFKSSRAQRTRRVRRLMWQCGRTWGLTGTPMPGRPEDLWGLLCSLGLDAQVFPGGWEEFVILCNGKRRFIRDKRQFGALRAIGYEWGTISPEVGQRLSRVMLRRTRVEVLPELPPCQRIYVPVATPEILPLLDDAQAKWDALGLGPKDIPPLEMFSSCRAALARARISAAVEWADNNAQASVPLLVFSDHIEPILAMQKLDGAGVFTGATPVKERTALVDAFKAGKLRLLAMTIDTGGASLNLQEAGAILFIDRAWVPGDNKQAELRAARPGSKFAEVLVAIMMSDHPLDRRLQEILDEKQRMQDEIGV